MCHRSTSKQTKCEPPLSRKLDRTFGRLAPVASLTSEKYFLNKKKLKPGSSPVQQSLGMDNPTEGQFSEEHFNEEHFKTEHFKTEQFKADL